MKRETRSITITVVALLVLSGLACSVSGKVDVDGPGKEAAPTTRAPAEATATPTKEPAPTETPKPEAPTQEALTPTPRPPDKDTPPQDVPEGQQPLDVAQIPELEVTTLDPHKEGGLSRLGTFRQRMTAEFVALDGSYSAVYRFASEVNTADQAVHITVNVEGTAVEMLPAAQVQAIWIGTRLWFKVGNQPWLPVPEAIAEMQFDEQMFAVGDFLPYAQQFQRVQPDETINGIPCARYTYDAQDLPSQYGAVSGHGEVYVALDGGYVVRYTLEASGTFEGQFQGEGTLELVYDTYDVGADIQIVPPRR